MCEAGSDARIRNKAKLTPAMLVDPLNPGLRRLLEEAAERANDDGAVFDLGEDLGGNGGEEEAGENDGEGSASDSDFDVEEYKREKERRKREGVEGGMI